MPKPQTTVAMTLVSNVEGTVVLRVNAKAAAGASVSEWSMDWGDGEEETSTAPLPASATHAYVASGAPLIIVSVKDSKGKVVSTGMNLLVTVPVTPVPPEPGTLTAKTAAAESSMVSPSRAWQYQQSAAPLRGK